MLERLLVVTGSTGSIGRHIPQSFVPLRTLNRQIDDIIRELRSLLSVYTVDLLHLAAVVGENKFIENKAQALHVNITLTEKLATEILHTANSRFHLVSSGHVYGSYSFPCLESFQCNPLSLYAGSKYRAEVLSLDIFRNDLDRLRIYRTFSVLGRNLSSDSLYGAIMRCVASLGKFRIANSDDIRDFLSPTQVATLLSKLIVSKSDKSIINVCSGIPRTVREACLEFARVENLNSDVLCFDSGVSRIPYLVGDPSLLIESIVGIEHS